MNRAGLIIVALLLAAAALAVLFWTELGNNLGGQVPFAGTQTNETRLVAQMKNAAAGGGYAVTFETADAQKWQLGAGHRFERFSVDGGGVFGRLTSSVPLNGTTWEWNTQGLSTSFPVEFNNRTNGSKVQIGIVARRPATNGSPTLSAVYATQQAGNSGWQELSLGPNFELKTFTFDVPPREPGTYTAQPILVINADKTGSGAAAEVLGVFVKPAQ
jgi:hypothetical protein